MITSVTTISGGCSSTARSPASALVTMVTVNPAAVSTRRMASPTSTSSSTTSMDAMVLRPLRHVAGGRVARVCLLGSCRQADAELRAAARCGFRTDTAPHGGHDAGHHREAQPCALANLARGEEGLEDVFHDRRLHAVTGVADFQQRKAPLPPGPGRIFRGAEAHGKPAARGPHRLVGVGAQVDDDLVYQARVPHYRYGILLGIDHDLDVG